MTENKKLGKRDKRYRWFPTNIFAWRDYEDFFEIMHDSNIEMQTEAVRKTSKVALSIFPKLRVQLCKIFAHKVVRGDNVRGAISLIRVCDRDGYEWFCR